MVFIIDVSGLESGSYFVRITSDKGSATGKFLKE
ncbi:MAG: T9SS type A sorting domain-containing protein [Flavobacterium sp.]|nr:T9SS type A sorting domain-containing protein [Flavobacterium sp.]